MLDRSGFVQLKSDEVVYVSAGDPEDPASYDSETTTQEAEQKARQQKVMKAGVVELEKNVTFKQYSDACDEFRRFTKSDCSSGMVTVGSKRIDMSLSDALTKVVVSDIHKVATATGEEASAVEVKMHVNGTDWYYPLKLKDEAVAKVRSLVKETFWNTEPDFNMSELILSKFR
jgi:hypothetical protein